MARKRSSAFVHIGTTLAEILTTTTVATAGAGNNSLLIGLATFAGAGIAASGDLLTQIKQLKSTGQQDISIEFPQPKWWSSDHASWEGFCGEICEYLPDILQMLTEELDQQSRVTKAVVRNTSIQMCVEVLRTRHFSWALSADEKSKVAPLIILPIMERLAEPLGVELQRIQREHELDDIRTTAEKSEEIADLLRQQQHKHLTLNETELAELKTKYLQALCSRHGQLDFKGIMHIEMHRPMAIPLSEVFVLPDLLVGIPEYETLVREEEEMDKGERAKRRELNPEKETQISARRAIRKEIHVTQQRSCCLLHWQKAA